MNKKKLLLNLFSLLSSALLVMITLFYLSAPHFLIAQDALPENSALVAQASLIVCDDAPGSSLPPCTFNKLVEFVQTIITFLIYISVPLASISFAYAGFLLMTSGGSESKKEKAKSVFTKTAIGFAVVLGAWLIIYFITTALIKPNEGFSLLKPGN